MAVLDRMTTECVAESPGDEVLLTSTATPDENENGNFGSYDDQWSKLVHPARHCRLMMAWHTCCFVSDMVTAAVIFLYGWLNSEAQWFFIISPLMFTVADAMCIIGYLTLGPLRLHSLSVWPIIGAHQSLQQLNYYLTAALLPTSKVSTCFWF